MVGSKGEEVATRASGSLQWQIQDLPEGTSTCYSAKFSEEMHENEESWAERGCVSEIYLSRSTTAISFILIQFPPKKLPNNRFASPPLGMAGRPRLRNPGSANAELKLTIISNHFTFERKTSKLKYYFRRLKILTVKQNSRYKIKSHAIFRLDCRLCVYRIPSGTRVRWRPPVAVRSCR